MSLFKTTFTSLAALALCVPALATTAEEKGFEIAERNDVSDAGFATSTVELTMTLADPSGRTTTRDLRIDTREKEGEGNGDRSVTVFYSPRDVEGTALLTHSKVLESDNQWLFLPALRRTKRISSSNKSGPFVGSEFSFEDIAGSELGKYEYTYLETITEEIASEALELDVLECIPAYKRSGYSKIHCHFDTEIYQARKFKFYDRGGQHLKTLILDDYREYDGGFWRAHRQTMTNHITGKETVLEFSDYEFGVDLNERDFEPEALERL
ncbi:MAG: outer membrane lipoprotein-sorting protein [Pseudomonadota bacterium]